MPAAGGTPLLARESGSDPEFDHTGARIYVREVRNEKYTLLSVGVPTAASPLPGRDEIEHVRSDNATQIVPSPDGRWVAFEERFRTYVAAFPRTGRPVDVGPAAQTYPVQRVSRDAGFYLHWSGDSRRLHWALGPELFTRELASSFAFVAGGQAKAAEPEAKGIPIGFTVKSDQPQGVVALVGARVITMANLAAGPIQGTPGVIENATVVVEGNRISAIGPSSSVTVPAGATRFDVKGKTIMPGIIDVHGHLGGESSGLIGQTSWPLAANLAFGVTTSHDPSNDSETVFTNAELVRAGAKVGPRVYSTGTVLYGAETPFKAVVENYEDALSHVRRQKALGAISVKSYNQQRRDARQMIVKASRELEILDVPEGGSLLYMNQTHVLDGHTGVEHSVPVPRLYKDTVELFAKSSVGYTPTLIVGYGGLSGEYYWYQHTNVWENERLLTFIPREVIDPRSRRRLMAPETDFNHVLIARGAKQIADAGGSVQLGAHGQLQGLGAHWELWMLQQGGMTPMESLRAATIAGARYLGLDGDIGSLEKGKLADLIVLDRNPLENIRQLRVDRHGDDERPALRRQDARRSRGHEAAGAEVLVELTFRPAFATHRFSHGRPALDARGCPHPAHDCLGDEIGGERSEDGQRNIRPLHLRRRDGEELVAVAGRVIRTNGPGRAAVGHHGELGQRGFRQFDVRRHDGERRAAERRILERSARRPQHDAAHHVDTVGEGAIRPAGAGDDPATAPVEHVPGSIDDGQRAEHDVAQLQARRAEPSLHPAGASAAMHLADRCARAGADVALRHGPRRRRGTSLVRGLTVGADAGIADSQVVDHRRDDNGNPQVRRPPIESDFALLEITQDPSRRWQREDTASSQEEAMNAFDRTDRLEHDDLRLARRGSVVVHTRRGGVVEEDGRAPSRPARVGEVPDLDAGTSVSDPGTLAGSTCSTPRRDIVIPLASVCANSRRVNAVIGAPSVADTSGSPPAESPSY